MKTIHAKRPHHNLDVWKVSMDLVIECYRITRGFPKEELFVLVLQMRRSAISIVSNIAEGAARSGKKELAHFLSIARGSLSELETQLSIAVNLEYLEANPEIFRLTDRIYLMLNALLKSLN